MSKSTQKQQLLTHMKTFGPITSFQAVVKYGILRPSNRIQELKDDGVNIMTEIVWKKKEDGSTTHYARYSLREA